MPPRIILHMSVEEQKYYKERAARGREEFKKRNERIIKEREDRQYQETLARVRTDVEAYKRKVAWDWFMRWFCCCIPK